MAKDGSNELSGADPADGLPVSQAGEWAKEKHKQLEHYIYATRHAREKWPSRGYFDLFSGPGRQRVDGSGALIDGSPLIAWKSTTRDSKGTFNHVLVSDVHPGFATAAEKRLQALGAPVRSNAADAVAAAHWARRELDLNGLHLVFADPYRLRDMPWEALRVLTELDHVDFIVHFSSADLTRNLDQYFKQEQSILDAFAPGWRSHVKEMGEPVKMRARFLEHWISLMESRGFKVARRKPLIVNGKNAPLYRLVFFSREDFPTAMWDAIERPDQSEMAF